MYEYSRPGSTWDGSAAVHTFLFRNLQNLAPGARVLDAGCGNGHLASLFADKGFDACGVDPSVSGITLAQASCPTAKFACLDLTLGIGDLAPSSFDVVTCIEVIEHVYSPRSILLNLFRLLKPGGKLIVTTPYHGYMKNAAVVLSGKFDSHFNPLWEDGHIKFFSIKTLQAALRDVGFEKTEFQGVGRIPGLWKTMMAVSIRPHNSIR